MLKPQKILLLALIISVLWSCKKSEGVPVAATMETYYPLEVGKYITYKLDSTVYVDLNTKKEVHSYIVQDKIDAIIKDNLGNDAYRVRRMIRSKQDTTQWFDNATFLVVPSKQKIEYVDNNLRFIKLINPVREYNTWYGNSYINSTDLFLRFYGNWEYFYETVEQPFTVNNLTFPETITVNQVDIVDGDPGDKRYFYEIIKSKEIYARGVGLVYKDFLHESWQEKSQSFETNSFGIKLTILNHNF